MSMIKNSRNFLRSIQKFLSSQECNQIIKLICDYENKILALEDNSKPNPFYGTTKQHGKYNWLYIIDNELSHIRIIKRLQTLIAEQTNYKTVWIKSWCNKLDAHQNIPYHSHSREDEPEWFFSANIFLSENTEDWHTYYETYGHIYNEQGTINLLSAYLPHAATNNTNTTRYSMAMDIYTHNPIKEDYYLNNLQEYKNLTKIYITKNSS